MVIKPIWVFRDVGQECVNCRELNRSVLLNGAWVEMLPENAPLTSPCRTIREEAKGPFVPSTELAEDLQK